MTRRYPVARCGRVAATHQAGRRQDMQQYEQDWMELGFRVAKAMHYQTR
jgi:hypothetical protein